MNQQYIFDIDSKNKVIIEIDSESIELCCLCNVVVTLCVNNRELYCNPVDPYLSMELFKENIMGVLMNNFYLHHSLNKNIGFLFNQYMYQRYQHRILSAESNIVYSADNVWIGKKYQLWGGNNITTWLYIASDGSIVLEVTPIYPDSFLVENFNHKDFFKWMNNYSPIFTLTLSRLHAQKWLQEVNQILYAMNAIFDRRDATEYIEKAPVHTI